MADIGEQVDKGQKKQSKGVSLTDLKDINEYLKFKLTEYKYLDFKDDDLQEQFQADFTGFTEEILKNYNQPNIRKLRTFLRNRSVQVLKVKQTTVVRSLYNILQEKDQIEQSKAEIVEHIATAGPFNSNKINYLI